jgi:hypothetical protein
MTDVFPLWLGAHLIGDFVLQDDDMAKLKSTNSCACLWHVVNYGIPWSFLLLFDRIASVAMLAILAQHFVQDRFALHLHWMRRYGQTPPDQWPVGPMCVDQALHVAWMALVYQWTSQAN